jgi:hypothetical protein
MRVLISMFFVLNLLSPLARAEEKEVYQTKLDFDSTMLDGKMKAPSGFFLQGRNKQSLTNLVKLRSNFKPQLKDSKAAVRSLVK